MGRDRGASANADRATRPTAQAPAGLGDTASVPCAWRTDALPFDQRPIRQFIWLSGERFHSGIRWRRDWWGLAFIRPRQALDARLGYLAEDIDRLEAEGDMDPGTAEIYGWLPATAPAPLDMERRSQIYVELPDLATEAEAQNA